MTRTITSFFALAVFLTIGLQSLKAEDSCPRARLISVTGTSEVSAAPDEVVVRLAIETRDKVLTIAKSQNDEHAKKVIELARSMVVDAKDVQTSALNMGIQYSEEKVPRMLGYEVSTTMMIRLRDLSKYDKLMTGLLEAGISRVNGVDFDVADPRKLRDEARSKAIRAAKEKATAMASDLGQTIGKPWEVSELNEVGAFFAAANSSIVNNGALQSDAPTIAPGRVTFKVSVRASFQME